MTSQMRNHLKISVTGFAILRRYVLILYCIVIDIQVDVFSGSWIVHKNAGEK
jgi:hypothetical protein